MSDQEAYQKLAELREWARAKWGDKPIDPVGPVVGGEVTTIPILDRRQPWEDEGEGKYVYTEEMYQRDYEANPHHYIPTWQYKLGELVGADEL